MGGRQQAELQVHVRTVAGLFRVCTVKLGPKDDLLFFNHGVLAGKTSNHPTGTTTHEVPELGIREYSYRGNRRGDHDGMRRIHGVEGGLPVLERGLAITSAKSQTRQRKILTVNIGEPAPLVVGVELWSYAGSTAAEVVRDAFTALPYESATVAGILVADWIDPVLAFKVWQAPADDLPAVIEVTNEVTGERYLRLRRSYVGTIYENTEGNVWLPPPRPREEYGPEPWDIHPAYHPELFGLDDDSKNRNLPARRP